MKEMENDTLEYSDQTRRYGDGFVRVGSYYECEGDIYTLAILSQVRDHEIAKYVDIATGETVP